MKVAKIANTVGGIWDMVSEEGGYLYKGAVTKRLSTNASSAHVTNALGAFNKLRFDPRADAARISLSTRLLCVLRPHSPSNAPTTTTTNPILAVATALHSRLRTHYTK